MGYGAAGMLHHIPQHLEFFWSEVKLLSHLFDAMSTRVQHDIPDDDPRFRLDCRCLGTTDRSAQPRGYFADLKGLCHIIISSRIERFYFVIFLVPHCKHNDGETR